jgi:ADP-ribose pyrophosphatase
MDSKHPCKRREGERVTQSGASNEASIVARAETVVSPWVRVVRKDVRFSLGGTVEAYHCLAQADYVAVLAVTQGGLIPLVRQFRPAVEELTWELPSGLVDAGEDPAETCRRELKEETGLSVIESRYLGGFFPDTGRLENRQHAFHVRTGDPDPAFTPESGMAVRYVTQDGLREAIRRQELRHQLHLGVILAASLDSFRLDER